MDRLAAAVRRMEASMLETMYTDLYRDHDPFVTEWANALLIAKSHYRKRRRKFFDLWGDDLERNRKHPEPSGLAARYNSLRG